MFTWALQTINPWNSHEVTMRSVSGLFREAKERSNIRLDKNWVCLFSNLFSTTKWKISNFLLFFFSFLKSWSFWKANNLQEGLTTVIPWCFLPEKSYSFPALITSSFNPAFNALTQHGHFVADFDSSVHQASQVNYYQPNHSLTYSRYCSLCWVFQCLHDPSVLFCAQR